MDCEGTCALCSMMAVLHAVSRRVLTAKTWIRARINLCGICGGQSGSGKGFSPSLRFSPVNIIPPLLHIHSCICWGWGGGWTMGPLAVYFHRDIVSPHRNKSDDGASI
jgi:hypothetical protein